MGVSHLPPIALNILKMKLTQGGLGIPFMPDIRMSAYLGCIMDHWKYFEFYPSINSAATQLLTAFIQRFEEAAVLPNTIPAAIAKLDTEKHQQALTRRIDSSSKRQTDLAISELPLAQQAQLLSQSAPGSSTFLINPVATQQVSNEQIRILMRLRALLEPFLKGINGQAIDYTALCIQADHSSTIARHNRLNNHILEIAKRAGFEAYEPRDNNGLSRKPDGIIQNIQLEEGEAQVTVFFDTTITLPTSDSNIVAGSATTRGIASVRDIQEKERIYAQDLINLPPGQRLLFLSAETFGLLSPPIHKLLRSFARKASSLTAMDETLIYNRYVSEVTCVLLKGFADRLINSYRVFMQKARPRELVDSTIISLPSTTNIIREHLMLGEISH